MKTKTFKAAIELALGLFLTGTASAATNLVTTADEPSLRAAINLGGWIGFGFNGTITITNTINITNSVVLDGKNVSVTISGANAVRLFYVAPGASLTVSNLMLADGSFIVNNDPAAMPADGAGIYNDGGNLTLVGCSLSNNVSQTKMFRGLARGGAIFNNGGTVSLLETDCLSNSVTAGGYGASADYQPNLGALGGAVCNASGSMMIANCKFAGNTSYGNYFVYYGVYSASVQPGIAMGGAVYLASGSITVTNSIFLFNHAVGGNGPTGSGLGCAGSPAFGGAVAINTGNLNIDRSQFILNMARGGDGSGNDSGGGGSGFGGAIYSTGVLTASDSSFSANQAACGISYDGNTAAKYNGHGGGIDNSGTATLNSCSVCSNSVQGSPGASPFGNSSGGDALGGGVFNAAKCAATNCTIAFNAVNGATGNGNAGLPLGTNGSAIGGGIYNAGNAIFVGMNLTVASNSCSSPPSLNSTYSHTISGLAAGSEVANVNGTLRLHNSILANGGTNSDAYGLIIDDGHNLCSDNSAIFLSGTSFNLTDPKLKPLANNGGPTLTMALLPTSLAIDFADGAGAPNADQRGYVRPFGSAPDIGAYEFGSYQPFPLALTTTTTNVQLSCTTTLSGTYHFQASVDLKTWADVASYGPLTKATNLNQTVSRQGFNARYFRVVVQ